MVPWTASPDDPGTRRRAERLEIDQLVARRLSPGELQAALARALEGAGASLHPARPTTERLGLELPRPLALLRGLRDAVREALDRLSAADGPLPRARLARLARDCERLGACAATAAIREGLPRSASRWPDARPAGLVAEPMLLSRAITRRLERLGGGTIGDDGGDGRDGTDGAAGRDGRP